MQWKEHTFWGELRLGENNGGVPESFGVETTFWVGLEIQLRDNLWSGIHFGWLWGQYAIDTD